MKNTTAMADYELRHIEALRKDLAGCTVLLKKDGSFPLEKPCALAAYGSGVRRTIRGGTGSGEVVAHRLRAGSGKGPQSLFEAAEKGRQSRQAELYPLRHG